MLLETSLHKKTSRLHAPSIRVVSARKLSQCKSNYPGRYNMPTQDAPQFNACSFVILLRVLYGEFVARWYR